MITGETSTGFKYSIEDGAIDDYELLEILCKIDKGDYGLVTEMVDKLLGEKEKERLKDHVRNESGRVSTTRMMSEVMEIFKSNKAGKN